MTLIVQKRVLHWAILVTESKFNMILVYINYNRCTVKIFVICYFWFIVVRAVIKIDHLMGKMCNCFLHKYTNNRLATVDWWMFSWIPACRSVVFDALAIQFPGLRHNHSYQTIRLRCAESGRAQRKRIRVIFSGYYHSIPKIQLCYVKNVWIVWIYGLNLMYSTMIGKAELCVFGFCWTNA